MSFNKKSGYLLAGALAVFSGAAQAQSTDWDEQQMLLGCVDRVMNSVEVPNATTTHNVTFTEFTERVEGARPKAEYAGIDLSILKDMTIGGEVIYDYRVTMRAAVYDAGNQDVLSSAVRLKFNMSALDDMVTETNTGFSWDLQEGREEDLVQLEHAAETMATYFTACMGLPIYERQDGAYAQPPAYFPQRRQELASLR